MKEDRDKLKEDIGKAKASFRDEFEAGIITLLNQDWPEECYNIKLAKQWLEIDVKGRKRNFFSSLKKKKTIQPNIFYSILDKM